MAERTTATWLQCDTAGPYRSAPTPWRVVRFFKRTARSVAACADRDPLCPLVGLAALHSAALSHGSVAMLQVAVKKEEPKEEVEEPPKKTGSGFFGFGTAKVRSGRMGGRLSGHRPCLRPRCCGGVIASPGYWGHWGAQGGGAHRVPLEHRYRAMFRGAVGDVVR